MRVPSPRSALTALLVSTLASCTLQGTSSPAGAPRGADQPQSSSAMQVTRVAAGLDHPWAVALLPTGGYLVTERPGQLRRIGPDGTLSAPLTGVPDVWAEGQGGLLDVVLAPDFETSQRIYLSYSEAGPGGLAGTAVARATLGASGLTDVQRIYQQQPKLAGPNHFGSRLAFDGQGHLFISQGDRNDRPTAQKLDMLQGKLVRVDLDGNVPADNPFVGRSDARAEIWSYGHRNIQGMAVDPRTGRLWQSEHGPRGGDEINLPLPGRNYGWPVISHGVDYTTGQPYPETVGTSAPGMEQPFHVWEKSPGLSGMAFHTGQPGSAWNDSLFLGALADRDLIRLSLAGDRIVGEERLLGERKARIRDVRAGADGAIYVLTDGDNGELLRIDPPRAR